MPSRGISDYVRRTHNCYSLPPLYYCDGDALSVSTSSADHLFCGNHWIPYDLVNVEIWFYKLLESSKFGA